SLRRALCAFGADGVLERGEVFDPERDAEALPRFDELTAEREPPRPVQRRVRPNAATAHAAQLEAAILTRDAQAFPDLFADDSEGVDHTYHTVFDRQALVYSWRSLLGAQDPTCRQEPLATLGDSLALCRVSISASGIARGSFDVGAFRRVEIHLMEVDAQGRQRRGERFAIDRLGDAVVRLYERYAELLPDGPARARAAATARSVAAYSGPFDADRFAAAYAPDIEV